MNPFELAKMPSAIANDYVVVTVKLLGAIRRDDPKRREGLLKIREWIDRELRGENASAETGAASGAEPAAAATPAN
jgi:cell division protein FtsI/penicillin-binding protein 2